jgi:hypothetical protein
VRKFTRDNWCSVEFDPFGFYVKDLITKAPLLKFNSSDDLYRFAGISKNNNNLALSIIISSVDIWHWCLGHPSNRSLNYLLSKFPLSCTNKSSAPSVCEAWHKGQRVRLPFLSSHTPT